MQNRNLADDYIFRAEHRLAVLDVLMERKDYADVVRESQEVIELCLKALLRKSGIEVPRLHDVSDVLKKERGSLRKDLQPMVENLASISKKMRRDRELSFCGTEDLTPSEFYEEEDAQEALDGAKKVFEVCHSAF